MFPHIKTYYKFVKLLCLIQIKSRQKRSLNRH
nr:MAG TPA: hypothetical protein [Caudoviricetes sp.]